MIFLNGSGAATVGEAEVSGVTAKQYARYVNPQWVNLLTVLGIDKKFARSSGAELVTNKGEVFLDFLSGYGVHNIGHNHPGLIKQLVHQLESGDPTMIQSDVPTLSAELAERLVGLSGGRITKVFFTNTGSEGVESAIKFARKFTRRDWILYASGGFHGLTCGALSLMSNQWWREGFGPLLEHTKSVPFGCLDSVREALKTGKFAAFIVEPIQGESGVVIPPREYFQEVQKLCDQYGTLLVCDEVQTGLYRTGSFLVSQQFGIEPDMVVIAKALSGGQVPVGALLMRTDICNAVYSSVDKSFVHASTFGENTLSMRAALTTLKIMEDEELGERSRKSGELLRKMLRERLARFEMVKEVRGIGLFNAIEFQPPKSLALKMLYASFHKLHPGLFGQMTVKTLFEEARILCQMAGNNYNVIKSVPPLMISEQQLKEYVNGVEMVCSMMVNEKAKFWTQGIKIGSKALSLGLSGTKEVAPEGVAVAA